MSTYLVTGGAGFIGSHLVRALIGMGHRVRVLDNLSSGSLQNLQDVNEQFAFVQADTIDLRKVNEAMAGADGVFHLAAVPSVKLSIDEPLRNQRSGEMAT